MQNSISIKITFTDFKLGFWHIFYERGTIQTITATNSKSKLKMFILLREKNNNKR